MKQRKTGAPQQHGIDFENEIHLITHGKPKSEYEKLIEGGYTSKFDLVKGTLSDINVSVKTTQNNNISCGDVMRMYDVTKNESFMIVLGHWKQVGNKKQYDKITEFDITPDLHGKLWGKIKFKQLKEYVDYVKSIPHGKEAQLEHQNIWRENIKDINSVKGIMTINTKVDSKIQRRTQCALDVRVLLENGVTTREYTDKYKGMKLPYVQNNKPRSFNK